MKIGSYRPLAVGAAGTLLLTLCTPGDVRANTLWEMPMTEVVAIASGARHTPVYLPEPIYPRDAIHTLGYRPAASLEEETLVVTTLAGLLSAKDESLHTRAAEALGRRGHTELLPQLFANLECEPYAFSAFFAGLRSEDGEGPPLEMVRAGLNSGAERVRQCILSLVVNLKISAVHAEVEDLLENDPAENIRLQAAFALRKIGSAESLPALERAIQRDPSNDPAIETLGMLGGDAQLPVLLRLLDSIHHRAALKALAEIKVMHPRPLVDALLRVLQEQPDRSALTAAAGLARYHDKRALPFLRQVAATQNAEFEADRTCVQALANIGGPDAVALLNEMLANGWKKRGDLETVLAKMGDANSARLAWALYRQHPVRRVVSGWCETTAGYHEGLQVLRTCADGQLLEEVRTYASMTSECTEERTLDRVVQDIEHRLSLKPIPPQS
jgi:HEAT repeat protein